MHIKQLKNVVGQVSVLPTPTAELLGVVYQYIGATDIYQHGYIYECVEINQGVYSWERVDVQPGGSRGRFLAIWNCVTGLAESNPPISPYEYKTGDYFVIGSVSSATPAVNYKPDGTSYVIGVASTTVETNEVAVDDTYFFDGTNWKLQSNSNKTVTYANIAGDIYDNASATTALNAKADNTTVNNHIANTGNPHSVTKAQVGLGNVDNTSDLNKPISTATQSALDGKQDTISDLATIRSNASAGKAANNTIETYGDIVTHDVAEFATAAQGAKADTALQAGDNVSELVNDAGYLVMGDLTNFVTKNTAQTISGLKTFSADIALSGTTSIKNTTSGVSYTMLYRDTSGIHVGTSTQALLLAGSGTRPTFNGNNVAMLADIPTAVSQLTNDSGFITNAVNNLQNYTLTSDLATVATSGSYNDLSNKPTIPAAQVNSDWNANSGVTQILNKPTLATVATSGSYNDLSNKPTIPTVNNPTITITQGGITKGSFTLNQATGDTIALDAGGGVGNIDNVTITANADDEIQAVGTVNQNTATGATNPIKSWLGDINEYNNQSVPTSNPDALCFIVDKTQTATDRYIVEAQYPDDTNGYTWYFLYSDGWVEQGGVITGNYTGTITLPVEMADTNYYISATVITTRSGASYDRELYPNSVDTTGFTTQNFSGGQNVPGRWMVQGLSA